MSEGDLYLKSNVEGMNNDELILFIYQEMLKVLKQVLYYFEKQDIEKRVTAINKGVEVLNALLSILNYDNGGEIAARLRSLYLYAIKKLSAANYEQNPKLVEEVVTIFVNLRDGWSEKLENDRKQNTPNAAAAFTQAQPETPSPAGGYGNNGGGKGLDFYG